MLFADVRGSSKLARQMPVIDFTRLMNRFYRESSRVLIDGDAIIEKFVGDAIVGLFIPFMTGPGHAARAIETAQELLRVTGHGSPEGPWVPLGAGVHTGTAFVGVVGSDSTSDFTALGDPVNIAAHLASQAAIGEVLVTDRAAERRRRRGGGARAPAPLAEGALGRCRGVVVVREGALRWLTVVVVGGEASRSRRSSRSRSWSP